MGKKTKAEAPFQTQNYTPTEKAREAVRKVFADLLAVGGSIVGRPLSPEVARRCAETMEEEAFRYVTRGDVQCQFAARQGMKTARWRFEDLSFAYEVPRGFAERGQGTVCDLGPAGERTRQAVVQIPGREWSLSCRLETEG